MAKAARKKTSARSNQPTTRPKTNSAAQKTPLFANPAWIASCRPARGGEARTGLRAFIIGLNSSDGKLARRILKLHLSRWQMDVALKSEQELAFFQGSQGPLCLLRLEDTTERETPVVDAKLSKSPYARARDQMASVLQQILPFQVDKIILELEHLSTDQRQGVLIGLELAAYSYAEVAGSSRRSVKKRPLLLSRSSSASSFGPLTSIEVNACAEIAHATNLARHLVNMPAGDLNPRTYANLVEEIFAKSQTTQIEIWEGRRLEDERMGLLNAVGAAAAEGPRLVHIRYRPKHVHANQQPIALVGKGITFDSGGLDIKPSSGMRLMKKDMGGSAACVGLAHWADASKLQLPLDIYLSLAENAIAGSAFRPGDILTSRQGLAIEIHNTDAEGRLVLADALDVAIKANEKPSAVIDVATLTGAIKVGLGGEIAGLFANDDRLANAILEAGSARGDLAWRMPLYSPYKSMLRSTFADYANASDGFAGAITAALFLELFVGDVPWAHLDVYSWKDGAGGAYSESGGSGQPVQMLIELLSRFAKNG